MTIIEARKLSYAEMCRLWRTVTKVGGKEKISWSTAFLKPARHHFVKQQKRIEHVFIVYV